MDFSYHIRKIMFRNFSYSPRKKFKTWSVGTHDLRIIFSVCLFLGILNVLGNSPLWHATHFWVSSRQFWVKRWAFVYQLFNENPFLLFVVATEIFQMLVFGLCNSFFAMLDLTGKPSFLLKYKLQEDKNNPVSWVKYKKCLIRVLFNTIVVGTAYQLLTWPAWKWRGVRYGLELPTFSQGVFHLLFFIMVEEVLFYYIHRLFHHPKLYKHVHKTHHEWIAPVGISASYCHPIEHFLLNTLPIAAGPMLLGDRLGNHLISVWVWIVIALLSTTISHCGYHLPFLPSPEAHDFHHSKFNQIYGVIGILDHLHGTDELFRQSKEHERHFLLFGLLSAKEIVPDKPKKQ